MDPIGFDFVVLFDSGPRSSSPPSSWSPRTPTARSTSTSAPAARRRWSRRARSAATAPRRRSSAAPPTTARGSSSTPTSRSSRSDTDSVARRLRALRRHDDADLRGPDQRQRRLRRRLRRRSADGTRVFFATDEQLVAADTDSSHRRLRALRRHHDARLGRARSTATAPSTPPSRAPRPTAPGSSSAPPSRCRADTDTADDVYERFGGTTTRISAGPDQRQRRLRRLFAAPRPTARASSSPPRAAGRRRHRRLRRRLRALRRHDHAGLGGPDQRQRRLRGHLRGASADGTRVFFTTAEQLVGADTDSRIDVYERSAARRRSSRRARSTATAPSAPLHGASPTAAERLLHHPEQLRQPPTPTPPSTSTALRRPTTLVSRADQRQRPGHLSRLRPTERSPCPTTLIATDTDSYPISTQLGGTTRFVSTAKASPPAPALIGPPECAGKRRRPGRPGIGGGPVDRARVHQRGCTGTPVATGSRGIVRIAGSTVSVPKVDHGVRRRPRPTPTTTGAPVRPRGRSSRIPPRCRRRPDSDQASSPPTTTPPGFWERRPGSGVQLLPTTRYLRRAPDGVGPAAELESTQDRGTCSGQLLEHESSAGSSTRR